MASESSWPKMIETFQVALEALGKDKPFQHLQQVITHNKELIHKNERLESANQGYMDNIADMRIQARETEKAAAKSRSELQSCQKKITSLSDSQEKAERRAESLDKKLNESNGLMSDLQRKTDQKQDRITQLEQESAQGKRGLEVATAAQRQLQSRLDTASQRLAETKSALEGYTLLTREVVDLEKDAIIATLEAIMSSIRVLVVTFVNAELSAEALPHVCKLAKKFPSIPMLNSNSQGARHMRIAAAMLAAAEALEEHIFQPTYLLDGDTFCRLLSNIAESDPVREAHIRAVLLPVKPHGKLIEDRLQQCVEKIESTVGLMVADGRKEEFSSALAQACEQICQYWMGLQRAEGSIEVKLDLEDSFDEENYRLLSSLIQEDLDKAQRPSDSSTRSSNGQNAAKKGPQFVDYGQAGPVVWPTFIWKSPDRENITCLQNCVVLSVNQVDNALTEQRTHREKRLARRESTSSNKPGSSSKGGKAFLSGGSAGKSNPG